MTEEGRTPLRTTIRFPLDQGACHGYESEQVWAEAQGGGFIIRNVPFFVKGISLDDTVAARLVEDGFIFDHVLTRGGHSTYRLIMQGAGDAVDTALTRLRETGTTWEEGPDGLFALDVPPEADIRDVYEVLVRGADNGVWDFEEGHVGHAV